MGQVKAVEATTGWQDLLAEGSVASTKKGAATRAHANRLLYWKNAYKEGEERRRSGSGSHDDARWCMEGRAVEGRMMREEDGGE